MQLLTATVDVVAQPGTDDLRTTQGLPAPSEQEIPESAVELRGKEFLGERADVRVLVWDVPVVPHEALPRRAPPGPETFVEDATHLRPRRGRSRRSMSCRRWVTLTI